MSSESILAPSSARHGWLEDRSVAPTVLILGGFLTSPPLYRRLRDRLLVRGAAGVVVGNVWTPDWLLVPRHGHGPIATRSGRALLLAGELAAASPLSKGAPILVVGHSAGGLTARLLTSPVPFSGRRFGGARRIGALVTLGTPHRIHEGWGNANHAADFVEEHVPGAFFAPQLGYLSVASTAQPGVRDGTWWQRRLWLMYARLVGPDAADRIEGDGVVPLDCALLSGARSIVLDDVDHGQNGRRPWYGSDEGLDRWWEAALDVWREALEVRRSAAERVHGALPKPAEDAPEGAARPRVRPLDDEPDGIRERHLV